jgi:hypothetical protein
VLRREGLYQSQIREWTIGPGRVDQGHHRASATASGHRRREG